MGRYVPLLLAALVLVGCPDAPKAKTIETKEAAAKEAPAKEAPAKEAPVKEAAAEEAVNEVASLPEVRYYAFKG